MRLLMICTSFALLTLAQAHAQTAAPSAQTAKTQERLHDMRLDELESTDSLAIPLDSSELEQDEELDDLEAAERRHHQPVK
jgi:hypothetical protein